MRILSLHIQNINSIKGEWNIDFRHPDYSANGLFAITGPTGAGKSTLLDAICLALYGRTPRIQSISPSGNEVMSRGAFECECRLTFEAGGQEYSAAWRQNRARKQSDGKLQKCDVRLMRFNTETGQWDTLASSITAINALIPEITGLTYKQFTRSVLLAQGSFSVFLKSKADDRAITLEQITGTDIYSEISKRVQQRHSAEVRALNDLKIRLSYHSPLSPDDRAALSERSHQLECEAADLNRRLKATGDALDWRRSIERLTQTVESTSQEAETLSRQWSESEDQRKRLDAAERAAALLPTYAKLQLIDSELTRIRTELLSSESKLQQDNVLLQQLEIAWRQAIRAEQKAQTERETLNELLIRVREIDTQLALARRQREQCRSTHTQNEALQTRLSQSLAVKRIELHEIDNQTTRLNEWIKGHAGYGACAEKEEELSAQCRTLQRLQHQYESTNDALVGERKNAETLKRRLQALKPDLQRLDERIKSKLHDVSVHEKSRQALLGEQTIEQCKRQCDTLAERIETLQEQRQRVVDWLNTQAQLQEQSENCARSDERLSYLEERLQSARATLEQCLEHRTVLRRLCAAERFVKEREALLEATPCPLCGSLDHPYVSKPPEADDDVKQRLREQDLLNEKTLEQTRSLQDERQRESGRRQLLEQTRDALQRQLDDKTLRARTVLTDSEENLSSAVLDRLNEQIEVERTRLARQKERLDGVDRLNQCLMDEQKALETIRNERDTVEAEARGWRIGIEQHAAKIDVLERELKNHRAEIDGQRTLWGQRLDTLGLNELVKEQDPGEQLDRIKTFARAYRDKDKERQTFLDRRTDLVVTIRIDDEALSRQEQLTRTSRQALADAEATAAELQKQRFDAFGERSCEQEERTARTAHETAQAQLKASRDALQAQRQALSALQAQIAQYKSDSSRQAEKLENLRTQWQHELEREAFESTEHWSRARMDEPRIRRERDTLDALRASLDASTNRLMAAQSDLQTQLALNVSERSIDELHLTQQSIQNEIQDKSSQLGEIKAQLKADDDILKEQACIEKQVREQSTLTERWSILNQLIGSADGKKYRTFVQGLTFDTLIVYANEALVNLSRRYVLARNHPNNLNLDVIDRDMAGIKRSCDNLSGGETFIISLALALGLSRMASKNVRIDSLFLDEGFGSLDEESLEKALTALSNLNQDRKLIGIISHVGRIQDRIPVRIQVQPTYSGVSTLFGPGVSKQSG